MFYITISFLLIETNIFDLIFYFDVCTYVGSFFVLIMIVWRSLKETVTKSFPGADQRICSGNRPHFESWNSWILTVRSFPRHSEVFRCTGIDLYWLLVSRLLNSSDVVTCYSSLSYLDFLFLTLKKLKIDLKNIEELHSTIRSNRCVYYLQWVWAYVR
jgi:hypothetical protein